MWWKKVVLGVLLVVGLCLGLVTGVSAQDTVQDPIQNTVTEAMPDVVRYPIPGSDFPISQAVELPADATLVYLSGQVPSVVDETVEGNTIAAFGNTETQTVTVLEKIQGILTSLELTMSDVVKMQVFLVGDPEMDGIMDFAGFMSGYTQFFGTEEQPNLPSRSAMQVAGLANPGWLVEIEVVAVR
ncbi:RidA family protein [cf. Phormidesmis sp. LEGE 11477]|uniref:RidA family protein n=1 Tax=cf. Phormidesmis sp. LEGE 11477 TaxID=1828680 RepID=UPI00188075CB|nr:RidA family protein [cf. Phormidesmis sp. LEGE 11477]MBE9060379.1 RidA family protein [cf. Phormidesmis sp. LEGE 11477]